MDKSTLLRILASSQGTTHPSLAGINVDRTLGKQKGQKRNARPKPSGAAAAKRASKKRKNIRKHS
jgi:hypothetical protein